MKTSRKNQDAVTIKDLEREIADLRIGIQTLPRPPGNSLVRIMRSYWRMKN